MGLAKKGTSRITVNGAEYRWVVSGNDDFLDLVFEALGGEGQRVAIQFGYDVGAITPRLVSAMIRKAQDNGWTPNQPAKALHFRAVGESLVSMESIRQQWTDSP